MDLVRKLVIASGIVAVILAIIHVFVIESESQLSNIAIYHRPIGLYQRAASDKTVGMYNTMDSKALTQGNAEFAMPGNRIAPIV